VWCGFSWLRTGTSDALLNVGVPHKSGKYLTRSVTISFSKRSLSLHLVVIFKALQQSCGRSLFRNQTRYSCKQLVLCLNLFLIFSNFNRKSFSISCISNIDVFVLSKPYTSKACPRRHVYVMLLITVEEFYKKISEKSETWPALRSRVGIHARGFLCCTYDGPMPRPLVS
jgi:hypothetical protein